jgi:hypothetical protein
LCFKIFLIRIIKTQVLTFEQKISIFELWNLEYPKTVCYSDISQFENYLKGLLNKKHYLLIDLENKILGWGFTFVRDNETWFAVILNSKTQRSGFGTLLVNELKENNSSLNGWVIDHNNEIKQNGDPYISPVSFYCKNGFMFDDNTRLENEIISAIKIVWKKV